MKHDEASFDKNTLKIFQALRTCSSFEGWEQAHLKDVDG